MCVPGCASTNANVVLDGIPHGARTGGWRHCPLRGAVRGYGASVEFSLTTERLRVRHWTAWVPQLTCDLVHDHEC